MPRPTARADAAPAVRTRWCRACRPSPRRAPLPARAALLACCCCVLAPAALLCLLGLALLWLRACCCACMLPRVLAVVLFATSQGSDSAPII
jgi:hypothetical protein